MVTDCLGGRPSVVRFNTRIKLCVYLTRKTPKARMVDIEEAGVILMFDKVGGVED